MVTSGFTKDAPMEFKFDMNDPYDNLNVYKIFYGSTKTIKGSLWGHKRVKFQTTSNGQSNSVNMFTLDKQLKLSLMHSSCDLCLMGQRSKVCTCVPVSACRHKISSYNCSKIDL